MSTTQATTPVVIPMSEGAHLAGCPSNPARVEHYEAVRPKDEKTVTVVRCGDCGEQEVHEGNIARVSRKLSENGDKANVRRAGKQEQQDADQ